MAKMAKSDGDSASAINTILIDTLYNTLVKFMIAIILGNVELRKPAFFVFCTIFFTGSAYFLFLQIFNLVRVHNLFITDLSPNKPIYYLICSWHISLNPL